MYLLSTTKTTLMVSGGLCVTCLSCLLFILELKTVCSRYTGYSVTRPVIHLASPQANARVDAALHFPQCPALQFTCHRGQQTGSERHIPAFPLFPWTSESQLPLRSQPSSPLLSRRGKTTPMTRRL